MSNCASDLSTDSASFPAGENGLDSFHRAADKFSHLLQMWNERFTFQGQSALKMPGAESNYKLGGKDGSGVEVDETFVGGKLRNMHRDRRARFAAESGHTGGATGKTIVVGMLDRDQRKIRAAVVPNVKRETLQNQILKNVKYVVSEVHDVSILYDHYGANRCRLSFHRWAGGTGREVIS